MMARAQKKTYTVGDIANALDEIAPPQLAQSWDNAGLMAGDRRAPAKNVLLCIDLTPAVLNEAIDTTCDFIVAYHPPIFRAIQKLIAQSKETDAIVHGAIANGIAIYSPHTALDAAPGGTNDVMAGLCGLTDVEPFEYVSKAGSQSKVVTFVPAGALEIVAEAMWSAGGGRIGDYERCSFRMQGEGTFFGNAKSNPQIGQRGRLEHVAETRLEVITSNRSLPSVIEALRRSHPYEEPAFDIYPLASEALAGIGRIGNLPTSTTLQRLAEALQQATHSRVISLIGLAKTRLRRAAVCVGAAGRLPLESPRAADCDVVVTGEIRHHDALALLRRQKTAIALGHWESERPVLASLAQRLTEALRGLHVKASKQDSSPITAIPRTAKPAGGWPSSTVPARRP